MKLKKAIGNILHARPFEPGHARFYLTQVANRERNARGGLTDADHLRATADWLRHAQDSQSDGGFSGRYKLHAGWTSSYPETTGYIIPTCLALAEEYGDREWEDRASRANDFLLRLQLDDGAFPGGEVAENTSEPSPFNTAQILNGLTAWAKHSGDLETQEAAARAAKWLISVQDDDGAFRKYFYWDQPSAYSAHLSCWIAEYGVAFGDEGAKQAAARHLDWTLGLQQENGWFERSGFSEEHHQARTAPTHTIAYTIWGVLLNGILLGREDAIDAAQTATEAVMRRTELSKTLPGMLDADWKSAHGPQCLTGNAQMALIMFELYRQRGDLRLVSTACKLIDLVKRAQDMGNVNSGIRGGVAGSDPVWGLYLFHALPNWAAKFFIDALLDKKKTLAAIEAGA